MDKQASCWFAMPRIVVVVMEGEFSQAGFVWVNLGIA